MNIYTTPSKKPKDEDGNESIDFSPDDIFSSKYDIFRLAENSFFLFFIGCAILFSTCIFGPEKINIGAVVLYPLLFASLYLVVNGLRATIKNYTVLILIGILMQIQILFLMNEYIITFRKDNSIFDDISSIILLIPNEAPFLIIVFTFVVQFSNFMMFYIHRKKKEITKKKIENLKIYLILNFIVLLLSFAFSLVTPLYRFASVIIYPQLFTQFYLVKNQFETGRMGILKYFGYGVVMQVHTLLLMFIYRSTWNLDKFRDDFFSSPSMFVNSTFYMMFSFVLYANVYNILHSFREEPETKTYLNHEHRGTMLSFSFNLVLLFPCFLVFLMLPSYRFGAVFLLPQVYPQLLLTFTRRYINYKQFLGFVGFFIVLQLQSWLLIDQIVMLVRTVGENGISSIFNTNSFMFVFVLAFFTFIFQLSNFVIYSRFIKTKDGKAILKKHRQIKVLFKLILLIMVFLLMWSLIFEQFRFASIVLVPQIFAQLYLVRFGLYLDIGIFKEALNCGIAFQFVVICIIVMYFPQFFPQSSDGTEKIDTTVFNSYPEFSHTALFVTVALTLFVQISNGISFYIHSKRDENRNEPVYFQRRGRVFRVEYADPEFSQKAVPHTVVVTLFVQISNAISIYIHSNKNRNRPVYFQHLGRVFRVLEFVDKSTEEFEANDPQFIP